MLWTLSGKWKAKRVLCGRFGKVGLVSVLQTALRCFSHHMNMHATNQPTLPVAPPTVISLESRSLYSNVYRQVNGRAYNPK